MLALRDLLLAIVGLRPLGTISRVTLWRIDLLPVEGILHATWAVRPRLGARVPGATGQGWLSLQGWLPLLVGKEEVVAIIMAGISSHWRQQERAVNDSKSAGGGRRKTQ
jgi:hypothetical protein